jgi:hypothetical protein
MEFEEAPNFSPQLQVRPERAQVALVVTVVEVLQQHAQTEMAQPGKVERYISNTNSISKSLTKA